VLFIFVFPFPYFSIKPFMQETEAKQLKETKIFSTLLRLM
jgi:hypothetical protein